MIDIKEAKKFIERKFEKKKEQNLELWKTAKNDFNEIVKMIIEEFNPIKIYQWGSLLNPDNFNENSDIDIAVEGIAEADRIFALWGRAMKMTKFPLDIIQLEKIEPEFAEIIKEKGIIIYEK